MTGFGYLFLGFGALAALGGLAVLIQRIRVLVSGAAADGVVVDQKMEMNHAGRHPTPVYHAVYEFRHDGKTYRCQSSLALPDAVPIGTRLRVRYLPSDPQLTAEVGSPLAMWGFPVAMIAMGVVLLLVALGTRG